MEVAGLAVGAVTLVSGIFKGYYDLLRLIEGHDDPSLYSTRLMVERARFETIVQQLSNFDPGDEAEISSIIVSLMRGGTESLRRTEQYVKPSGKYLEKFRWAVRDKKRLEEAIEDISKLNDQLALVVQVMSARVSVSREHTSDLRATSRRSDIQELTSLISGITGESVDAVSERLEKDRKEAATLSNTGRSLKKEQPRGPVLQRLVSTCDILLNRFAEDDRAFAEASNMFRLWKFGLESEGLYHAIDSYRFDSTNIRYLDLERLLSSTLVRLGTVLTWWAETVRGRTIPKDWIPPLNFCAAAMAEIRIQFFELPQADADDLLNGQKNSPEESTKAVLRTVELILENLGQFLPSLVRFSRQYAVPHERITASDVTRLLDSSIALIPSASEAFSDASKADRVESFSKGDSSVDLEAIQRVFREQTAQLQKWQAKHREDVELKLAEGSPAKLASVADAVENIAKFLPGVNVEELPVTLQGKSRKTELGQTLEAMMKGFEASIQSLVTLEPQLASIDAPPSYQKATKDRAIVGVTGQIERDIIYTSQEGLLQPV